MGKDARSICTEHLVPWSSSQSPFAQSSQGCQQGFCYLGSRVEDLGLRHHCQTNVYIISKILTLSRRCIWNSLSFSWSSEGQDSETPCRKTCSTTGRATAGKLTMLSNCRQKQKDVAAEQINDLVHSEWLMLRLETGLLTTMSWFHSTGWINADLCSMRDFSQPNSACLVHFGSATCTKARPCEFGQSTRHAPHHIS